MFKFRQKTHFISAARAVSGQIERVKERVSRYANANRPGAAEGIVLDEKRLAFY